MMHQGDVSHGKTLFFDEQRLACSRCHTTDGTAGRAGAIVNLASSAVRGDPRGVHYSASKAGVIGLTRAMALALAPHRVRVNAIAPGTTDTAQPRYGNTEEQLLERARQIPMGRMAQPDEIARVAVFLASDEAVFITGEVIHANGGSYVG